MPDKEPAVQPNRFKTLVGSFNWLVPSVRPAIRRDTNGQVSFDIDLNHEKASEALNQLEGELNQPRFKEFRERVLTGRSKAFYNVVFGGISVIVVTAVAGVEFGSRHGQDIKRIFDILEERRKK